MSVFKLLKEDHQKVIGLIDELLQSSTGAVKSRKQRFGDLVKELTIHTQFEEQVLYPELKKNTKIKNLIFEAYEEHHLVDFIINEMQQLEFNDETWIAKLTVLKECLRHHIKEEEKSVFPKAKQFLKNDIQKQIKITLIEFKDKNGMLK